MEFIVSNFFFFFFFLSSFVFLPTVGRTSAAALETVLVTIEGSDIDDDHHATAPSSLEDFQALPRHATCLRRLTLSWCGLSLRNIGPLCRGVQGSSNLLHLNLSHNNFSGLRKSTTTTEIHSGSIEMLGHGATFSINCHLLWFLFLSSPQSSPFLFFSTI